MEKPLDGLKKAETTGFSGDRRPDGRAMRFWEEPGLKEALWKRF